MCADRRRARGQALAETLVAMLALVPLLFGIAWVAKLIDMQQSTQQAARALAFECTVRPAACTPDGAEAFAGEARIRFFAAHLFGLRSAQEASGPAAADVRRASWVDRRGRPLLERFDDVDVGIAHERFDSPLAFAGGAGDRAFPGAVRVVSELAGPGRFGLDLQGGLVDASVRARTARGGSADGWVARLSPVPLTLRANVALLVDAWNASGPYGPEPDTVESRVASGAALPLVDPLIDAGWLAVRGLLAVAGALRIEPAARELRWHETDVDLVPPDRIGGPTHSAADVADRP